jgi:hypothetical protein
MHTVAFDKFSGRVFNVEQPLYLITTNAPLVFDRLRRVFVQVNNGAVDAPYVDYLPDALWGPEAERMGLAKRPDPVPLPGPTPDPQPDPVVVAPAPAPAPAVKGRKK